MDNINLKYFSFVIGEHKNERVIWIKFDPNKTTINNLKKIATVKYSATNRMWYVKDHTKNRSLVGIGMQLFIHYNELTLNHQLEFDKFYQTLKLKSYSSNTIKTYCNELIPFFRMFSSYNAHEITVELIKRYLMYCAVELKLSEFTINSRMNAIKFYYEKVLHNDKMFFDIPRPKKPLILPKVLSVEEVRKIINLTANLKHQMILKCIYGMGLRVSEVINLKIEDFDSDTMLVYINLAKGKKDRVVVLPDSLLPSLREYYIMYKPTSFLFENKFGGQMSVRSIQAIFKKGLLLSKSRKKLGVHSLRHSFATHLLENGTDVTLIQQLLGHNNIKTTLTYTHVTRKSIQNVQSPLDKL